MVSAFGPPDSTKEKPPLDLVSKPEARQSSPNQAHPISREDDDDSNRVDVRDIPANMRGKHRPLLVVNAAADSGDTEDEEVKMNCMGGLNGIRDSDVSSEDSTAQYSVEDETEDVESDAGLGSEGERGDSGLVNFVSSKVEQTPQNIRKPTPIPNISRRQVVSAPAYLNENNSEGSLSDSDSSSSSSSSSSGARGIGLTLETSEHVNSGDDRSMSDKSTSDGDDQGARDDESEMSSDKESQDEDERSAESEESKYSESEDDNNVSAGDAQMGSTEEQNANESDDDRENMVIEVALHEGADAWDVGTSDTAAADSNHLRRPSLTVDEIEDMLDASPCENDNSRREACDEASEKLNQLFSDSLEFDFWSSARLAAVVDVLSSVIEKDEGSSSEEIRPLVPLPPRDNAAFWVDKMGIVILPESRLKKFLVENPDQRISASRLVCDAFHRELTSFDLTQIVMRQNENVSKQAAEQSAISGNMVPKLFVGSFSAADSRLVLALLGIKRVIQISYHPLDEMWVSDGVAYSTHILPSLGNEGVAPVHLAIKEAANEVATSLEDASCSGAARSVLVACSTGDEHSCAVCALYLSNRYHISAADATEVMIEHRSSCRIDPEWLDSGVKPNEAKVHKTKRVLSSNLLSDVGSGQCLGFDSPKRMRCSPANVPLLPTLCLGPAANESNGPALKMRGSEEYTSSSTEGEEEREQDIRLSEELEDSCDAKERPSTPIPLLTPPASPVIVESEAGTTTVCEWPSNLTVDSAMTAAIGLRPLSPNSLQRQDEEDEKRIVSTSTVDKSDGRKHNKVSAPSSMLTPIIRGMSVKFD